MSTKTDYFEYVLDGKGGYKPVEDTQKSPKGVTWIQINYSNPEHKNWLKSEKQLPKLVCSVLQQVDTRPKTTVVDDGLLIVLRSVNLNPESNPEDMVCVRLWLTKDMIISSNNRKLMSISDVIKKLEGGNGPINTADFFIELTYQILNYLYTFIDGLEDRIDSLEERALEQITQEIRVELAELRRQIIGIRRFMAPQREAISRLLLEKLSWFTEDDRLALKETSDRMSRVIEDIDTLRERAMIAQEEVQDRLAEQMNNRMYVLSVITAIFLPLGFLTGLLGVNVGGIPGGQKPAAFIVFCLILIILVVLQIVYFRWKKWM